jgi:amidase
VSGFADYERYDALGLADLVRRKAVSPEDLLDAAIERVEARNQAVNAIVMPLYDYGRKAIADGLPEGPFRGVPFLLKDLGGWLAGVRVTRGSQFFADAPAAAADSEARAPAQARRPCHLRPDEFVRARPLPHL